jgi:hypothetical protein
MMAASVLTRAAGLLPPLEEANVGRRIIKEVPVHLVVAAVFKTVGP